MTNYNFDENINRKSERCRKWDKKIITQNFGQVPDDFIPMWIADMDFKSPEGVLKAFHEVVERGTFGYTSTYDEFYDAVINWQKEQHSVTVEKDWVTLSYGTVSTLHYIYQAFCTVERRILINTPVYNPFANAATNNGVSISCNPLELRENRYYIDFDHLEKLMIEDRPRLFIFCSPHNPSGRIWSREEIAKIYELCLKHDVILVADEVHSEHILYGKHTSTLAFGEAELQNLIFLTSPNKAFNLGGLKTSYSIIPNEELRQIFRKRLQANSITSPNVFGIIGIITAYNQGENWLDGLIDYIKGTYEAVKAKIEQSQLPITVIPLESSYLLWVDVTGFSRSSQEIVSELASNYGVLLEDGSHFVQGGEGYLRLNLGMPREQVLEAVDRMITYFTKLKK